MALPFVAWNYVPEGDSIPRDVEGDFFAGTRIGVGRDWFRAGHPGVRGGLSRLVVFVHEAPPGLWLSAEVPGQCQGETCRRAFPRRH
jgi:hypothetical protein